MESKLKKNVVISNIYLFFGIVRKSSLPVTDSYIFHDLYQLAEFIINHYSDIK